MSQVLAGIRQSKRRDLSESPETQRKDIKAWVDRLGHVVASEAVDIGVTASVSPFKRPQLGPWLTDPELLAQWDILAVWKVDRVVRSLAHFYGELVPELERLGKKVVAVTEGIDTSSSSAIEVAMRVTFAQDELSKLKDRSRSSRARLRENARWHGGVPYFGYVAVKTPLGMKLAIDEDAQEAIRTVLDLLRRGYNLNYICGYLNQEGVLTAWDRHAVNMGRAPKMRPWRRATLQQMLERRTLMGQMNHGRDLIRDDLGNPVQFGEPILTREEWDETQDLIQQEPKSYRRKSSAPLLRIAYCNSCGKPMYQHPSGPKDPIRRYYCSSMATKPRLGCEAYSFPAEELEKIVEELYLDEFGDDEIVTVSAVARVDYASKIKGLDEKIGNLAAGLGALSAGAGFDAVTTELNRVQAERAELVEAARQRQGVEYTHTGRTYRQEWEASGSEKRLELLREHGVYVMVQRAQNYLPHFVGIGMGAPAWTYTTIEW